ncbi:hypothetical protein [Haladaptatus sp. NG-SE-30]
MARDIDYAAVDIPDDKPPEEYHYTSRRAEILQLLEEAGHPRRLNQSRLADRYGCTPSNINNDMDVLAKYIDEKLGDRRIMITESVFHRAMEGLLDREEYRKAAQTVKDWNEFINDYHWMENVEERLDQLEEVQGDDIP